LGVTTKDKVRRMTNETDAAAGAEMLKFQMVLTRSTNGTIKMYLRGYNTGSGDRKEESRKTAE